MNNLVLSDSPFSSSFFRALRRFQCPIHNFRSHKFKVWMMNFGKKSKIYLTSTPGYPAQLMNRYLNYNIEINNQTLTRNTITTSSVKNDHYYLKLIYVRELSESLAAFLSTTDVSVIFKNVNTVRNSFFTRMKGKTDKLHRSNIIYKIPCDNCDQSYVGQRGRYLKTRINEHERSVRGPIVNPKTAIAQHSKNSNHNFNFDITSIIGHENFIRSRTFLEMLAI